MLKRAASILFVFTLVLSALLPAAASVSAAEATTVTHFVLKKDNNLYAIDIKTYQDLKAVGLHQKGALSGSSIAYLQAGDGKRYETSLYSDAKATISNATVSTALAFLSQRGLESTNLSVGTVVVGSGGSITLNNGGAVDPVDPGPTDPVEDNDFAVIGIE